MHTLEQVEQNVTYVNSFPGKVSSAGQQTIAELKKIYEQKIKVPCTSCQYCLPCPEGIHIPENLWLLNQSFWIGKAPEWIKKWYREMESDDPATNWHEKGAASRCTQCGECLDKCPQGIQIPDELVVTRKLLEDNIPMEEL
jgi:predicted aldo/keto reductase-like oxidoreductase